MQIQNRILVAFNKFYGNFIKDVKATNDEIRLTIKKHYKLIDKLSEEYLLFFKEQVADVKNVLYNEDIPTLVKNDDVTSKTLIKDVTIKTVLDAIDNDVDKQVFWNYIFILTLFMYLKDEVDTCSDEQNLQQVELLFNSVIEILGHIQNGNDASALIGDILDDDVKQLLSKIHKFENDVKIAEDTSMPPFGNMQDSMICNLAKEISNEIDVSNINVEKPEDVLKLMDFSSSNNLVGDIIKKVSTKIHDKISSGELKQEELFGEAMNMMGMLNMGGAKGGMGDLGNILNNPMMGEMMKAMKKGKAVPKQDAFKKSNARDRLRAKLDERRKQQNKD